ncbi:type VI secretion system baseplate subunit TssF [Nitrosomonas communis]|uniref:Type VI secretion system protein ImpG n=1 Tax=Nitrosomonas communis TaxID=44574 RepID=A0A1H2V472_9PROT|nr:type VI secretion system baseplate subunit TssF [Nitrosomonas communis]SDW62759.1 type VI secretion system protein ImpG [Nitrosomonas communis]
MDPRLLRYYNQELQYLHEMGAEFAKQFPKIAARLGMEGIEVADPYIERLMEGASFMAARVQLKLDAEFPRFTQRLLEIVYPNFLAPTPAMLIAQLRPQLTETNLATGFTIPRGSAMRSRLGKDDLTPCEFRTSQDVMLWPIELVDAKYFSFAPDLPLTTLPIAQKIKAGVRLRFKTTAGLTFNQINLQQLPLFLSGSEEIAYKLHELCFGALAGILVMPSTQPFPWQAYLEPGNIYPIGYLDNEALLPATLRTFQGYRLIEEYFSFPQRFLFMGIEGLGPAVKKNTSNEMEIVLLFKRGESMLENVVNTSNFSLFCTPAINLFSKRADRIHLSENTYEYHVVADRTRPMDFEIYDVTQVTGYGVGSDSEQPFLPFYATPHTEHPAHRAYFTIQRQPRLLSASQKQNGFRSSYIGSEVFVSLVDPEEAPFSSDLRQLAVTVQCTNRDLPIQMPLGMGKSDFTLDSSAPLEIIRCIKGPSKPSSALGEGAIAWRLINHLSLNYLSLINTNERDGAATLRELLELYATRKEGGLTKQIEGVQSVRVKPIVRRLPVKGPICFGRGLEIELEVDEFSFQGGSAFLFGCVMERFFAHYVSINSFTETVLRSTKRGEMMRWVPKCGNRPIL